MIIIAFIDFITKLTMDGSPDVKDKKPFNKRKWREKKYGHEHKVDQWKDKHKHAAKMKYKRLLKKEEKTNPNFVKINKENNPMREKNKKTPSAFTKAVNKFEEQKSKKQQKEEALLRKQEEKKEAVKKYKEKKAERLKILNAKTKRGQPKMGGRIELLLAKIEEQCKND